MNRLDKDFLKKIYSTIEPLSIESDKAGRSYAWFVSHILASSLFLHFTATGENYDSKKLARAIELLKKTYDETGGSNGL